MLVPLADPLEALDVTGFPRRGWRGLRALQVDQLKRMALRRLHRSARGEAWLLASYLQAEQVGEASGVAELERLVVPEWLRGQMRSHLADEQRHVRLIETELRRRGVAPNAAPLDPVSRWKLWRLKRVASEAAARFSAGEAVPAVALGLVMEKMGVRFMSRHADVLRRMRSSPRTSADAERALSLVERILLDEERHVALFRAALGRLVAPSERAEMARLLARLESVDQSWSLTGALGLLAASFFGGRA